MKIGIGRGKGRLLTFVLVTTLVLIVYSSIVAWGDTDSTILINEVAREYDLTNTIQILVDREKVLNINDLFDAHINRDFIYFNESKLSGVISDSAYWIRVDIKNITQEAQNMFLDLSKPHLGNVIFYRYSNDELIKEVQTGRQYSFHNREINHRNFVFEINLLPETQETLFFRVETESYLQLPMKLYKAQNFIEKEYKTQLFFGLYYGIMLAMLLYNLVLYLSLKDSTYLYYVLYLFGFAIMQLIWDGLAFQYFWPLSPAWDVKANPFFLIFTAISAVQFSRSFLRVNEKSKLADKAITYLLITLVFIGALTLFISPSISIKLAVYIVSMGLIICIANIWVVGFKDRSVYLYTLAWAALFVGALMNLLAAYRILPLNWMTLYSPRIGSVFEVVLLSLALVDRFNRIKQEKVIEEKQRVLLKTLNDITKTLTSTHDLDILLKYILKNVTMLTKYDNGILILKHNEKFIIKEALGFLEDELKDQTLELLDQDTCFKRMLEENKAVTLTNVDMNYYSINKIVKVCTGIPIIYHEELLGLLVLYSMNSTNTNDFENKIFFDFAGQVGISIQNLRLFNEVKRMATIDGLTGVFNRNHFTHLSELALKELQKSNVCLSLIMLDIDHFKQINDGFGHLGGDKVLQQLVACLKEIINSNGIIGRYGGEEFLILLKETNINEAYKIAEKIRKSVEKLKVYIDDVNFVQFTISIGVSTANKDMIDIWELIEKADQALYLSKESGRNLVNIC